MAMTLSITCPACAVAIGVPPELVGQTVACPNCHRPLVIRGIGPADRNPGMPPPHPPARRTLALVLVLAGAFVFLGSGILLVVLLLSGDEPAEPPSITGRDHDQDAGRDRRDGQRKPPPPPAVRYRDKLHLLPADAEIPAITYFFHDNLHPEEKGAPDLVPTDPLGQNGFEDAQVLGLRKRVYRYTGNAFPVDQQAGLTFDNHKGRLPVNQYSVEIVLMFLQADGRWRRIVDVQDRQSDDGFYADPENHLQVYPEPGKGKLITSGGYHHVVLTVAKDNTVKAYLDGSIQFTATTPVMVINNPREVVHFFLDNTVGPGQGEFSNGKVAVIRLYDRVLTDQQVARLAAWVRGSDTRVEETPAPRDVAIDPGNLMAFENQIGKTFVFRVTGSATGSVWGTDVYTADSNLATAAVHAGVLKSGQTGVVRVQMVAGLQSYAGSTRNGVTSGAWSAYGAAYTVRAAEPAK
jgi:hypothetical protein